MSIQEMVKRIAAASGAFQFDDDTENLFPELPQLEDMEDAASGEKTIIPRKTLRNKDYQVMEQPLTVRPDYHGDFLDKLREEVYKNKSAESLLDFDMPSDLAKYIPETQPRDLQDEFYDINRPGEGAGYDTFKQYYDRGWDEDDAPEMSEDKVLRERGWENKKPQKKPTKNLFNLKEKVVNAFITQQDDFRAQSVIAKFLMELMPEEVDLTINNLRVAKLLRDFDKSLIYTKEKGWRKPEGEGVSARLIRAEPRVGRWTFMTTSGKESYTTVFQFIPQGSVRDPNKLHVRCSCTCPSWLFWGAQYNAVMNDYLYGPIKPKFTPPKKRDPTGRFMVCKHVLACIPVVSKYKVNVIEPTVKERIKKTPKIEIQKGFKEKLRIPNELVGFARRSDIKEAVRTWKSMPDNDRREFIMGLDSPGAVSFMAHRFPDTATGYVVEKLKEMSMKERMSSFRDWARRLLKDIV
jgi:hypothetical protein